MVTQVNSINLKCMDYYNIRCPTWSQVINTENGPIFIINSKN